MSNQTRRVKRVNITLYKEDLKRLIEIGQQEQVKPRSQIIRYLIWNWTSPNGKDQESEQPTPNLDS